MVVIKDMKHVCIAGLLLVLVLIARHVAAAAQEVSCGDAVNSLIPCGPFLIGAAQAQAQPSDRCCRSAQELKRMASTTDTRRSLCRCLEQAGPSFGVNPHRAAELVNMCKLGLDVPISADINCNMVP